MTRHFDYHTRGRSGDNQTIKTSAPVVSSWLLPGNRIFLEVASMVITWWIVAFMCSDSSMVTFSIKVSFVRRHFASSCILTDTALYVIFFKSLK